MGADTETVASRRPPEVTTTGTAGTPGSVAHPGTADVVRRAAVPGRCTASPGRRSLASAGRSRRRAARCSAGFSASASARAARARGDADASRAADRAVNVSRTSCVRARLICT